VKPDHYRTNLIEMVERLPAGGFQSAMGRAAAQLNVPLLDLYGATRARYRSETPAQTSAHFVDAVHFTASGARMAAELIASESIGIQVARQHPASG